MKWIKASERLPEIKVVEFQELITYGVNNGANIVNGMPWSFNMNGHPVTHENDEKYLVGANAVHCTPKHPIVFTNGGVVSYWKDNPSKMPMATLHIKDERLADGLICLEGYWCLWDKHSRGSVRLDKLSPEKFADIEWLDESPGAEGWVSVAKELPPKTSEHYYFFYHERTGGFNIGEYNYDLGDFYDQQGKRLHNVSHWQKPSPPLS